MDLFEYMSEKKKERRVRGMVIKRPGFRIFQKESVTRLKILVSMEESIQKRRKNGNLYTSSTSLLSFIL